MPFRPKKPSQLHSPISRPVREAREAMAAKGWSYRSAAPVLGVTYQHLAHVLTGRRASRRLTAAVLALPIRKP